MLLKAFENIHACIGSKWPTPTCPRFGTVGDEDEAEAAAELEEPAGAEGDEEDGNIDGPNEQGDGDCCRARPYNSNLHAGEGKKWTSDKTWSTSQHRR